MPCSANPCIRTYSYIVHAQPQSLRNPRATIPLRNATSTACIISTAPFTSTTTLAGPVDHAPCTARTRHSARRPPSERLARPTQALCLAALPQLTSTLCAPRMRPKTATRHPPMVSLTNYYCCPFRAPLLSGRHKILSGLGGPTKWAFSGSGCPDRRRLCRTSLPLQARACVTR